MKKPIPVPLERTITSPSNLARRKVCPGSARLEAEVPADTEESEYSIEGTFMHGAKRDPAVRAKATPAQLEVLQLCEQMENDFLDMVIEQESIQEAKFEQEREKPLRLVRDRGNPDMLGTTDFLRWYRSHGIAIIIDYKMGYLEVSPAETNAQLAAYAAMLYQTYPFMTVYLAIIQPRAPYGQQITTASYSRANMDDVSEEIEAIIDATEAPGAPLHATPEACRYCRAKPICPEYRKAFQMIQKTSVESLLALPAAQFGMIGDAIKLAAMLRDKWNEEAVRRIESGEMPGWHLKNNGSVMKLDDLSEAYSRFSSRHFGSKFGNSMEAAHAFLSCMEVKWGKLDKLFARLEGCSEKKARGHILALMDDLVTKEEKSKSPVRDSE